MDDGLPIYGSTDNIVLYVRAIAPPTPPHTPPHRMTYFTENGLCVPATVIALESDNHVTAVKTTETDGYNAVQVGYKAVREQKVTKPELGHLAKSGSPPLRHIREFRVSTGDTVIISNLTAALVRAAAMGGGRGRKSRAAAKQGGVVLCQ